MKAEKLISFSGFSSIMSMIVPPFEALGFRGILACFGPDLKFSESFECFETETFSLFWLDTESKFRILELFLEFF